MSQKNYNPDIHGPLPDVEEVDLADEQKEEEKEEGKEEEKDAEDEAPGRPSAPPLFVPISVPPPASPAGLRVISTVPPSHPSNPASDGTFFRFWPDDLGLAIGGGYWSDVPSPEELCVHVKGGGGAVFLAKNTRTEKVGGVIFWGAEGRGEAGVGCFNPVEYAEAGDWRAGDEVVLLDYTPSALQHLDGLVSSSVADLPGSYSLAGTGTGWNLDAENLRFGRCGIVGDWWKELSVVITFIRPVKVGGVRTDSPPDLPYKIESQTKGGAWELVEENCQGNTRVEGRGVTSKSMRLTWANTDLHKMKGLSTYRSGGGIHAEIWLEFNPDW